MVSVKDIGDTIDLPQGATKQPHEFLPSERSELFRPPCGRANNEVRERFSSSAILNRMKDFLKV